MAPSSRTIPYSAQKRAKRSILRCRVACRASYAASLSCRLRCPVWPRLPRVRRCRYGERAVAEAFDGGVPGTAGSADGGDGGTFPVDVDGFAGVDEVVAAGAVLGGAHAAVDAVAVGSPDFQAVVEAADDFEALGSVVDRAEAGVLVVAGVGGGLVAFAHADASAS